MLQIAFEPQRLLEKAWTAAQCDSALGLTAVVVNRQNSKTSIDTCTSITPGQPTGSCNIYVKTHRHRAGVCNNSSVGSMNTTAYTRQDNTPWNTASASVPANGSYLWTSHPGLNSTLTDWQPSKMRLTAAGFPGNNFHARLVPN
jgi:hypothetical protein